MQITSPKNSLLLDVRKAAANGEPTSDGLIVAEGPHLLEEALRSRATEVRRILATADAASRFDLLLQHAHCEVVEVADRAFASTAGTEGSQGILALVQLPVHSWKAVLDGTLVLALDGVQDPGNVGTLIRSAEAFGAGGVILLKGCARVANGKLLRATAGSIFRMPFLQSVEPSELIAKGRPLFSLLPTAEKTISEVNLTGPAVLVVGSEGAGVCGTILKASTGLRIPSVQVESLNAAIAGSIALFESARQRRLV